jgi:hypothetical protein
MSTSTISTSTWLIIFLVLSLIIFVVVLGLYYFLNKKNVDVGCTGMSGEWQRPYCVNIIETELDLSIPKPQQKLYLGDFSYDPNLQGGPICSPMYYAFRYVRESDGKYGPLSNWTTVPVQSGATNLPCVSNSVTCQTGKATCNNNRPVIVTVESLDYAMSDGYILNLHRQIGTLDTTNEGDIVGMLLAVNKDSPDGNGFTSHWVDVMFNPNSRGQICRGC